MSEVISMAAEGYCEYHTCLSNCSGCQGHEGISYTSRNRIDPVLEPVFIGDCDNVFYSLQSWCNNHVNSTRAAAPAHLEEDLRALIAHLIRTKTSWSAQSLIRQLYNYCDDVMGQDVDMCRLFVHATADIIYNQSGEPPEERLPTQLMLTLLWEVDGSLQTLFTWRPTRCHVTRIFESVSPPSARVIDSFLREAQGVEVMTSSGRRVRPIDAPLGCGETPLAAASRHMHCDLIHVLLQHGASTSCDWLAYTDSLQVLLFTPNCVSGVDREVLRCCLHEYSQVIERIDIQTLRSVMCTDGYYPRVENWLDMLPTELYRSPCSLKQACRVRIRQLLNTRGALPAGLRALPLPSAIKGFLDLRC